MIPNQWYAVLESNQLGRKRPLRVIRLNEELVFWRDAEGAPHCTHDRCPHRGASLAQGEIKQDRLACPFHGFEFDGQGRCQFIPAIGRAGRPPKGMRVQAYPLREAHDFIWLWWGPPRESYPPLPFFEEIDDSYGFATVRDPWTVHYSRAVENQLDVVHLPFVHRTTIGRGNRTVIDGPVIQWQNEDTMLVWVYNRLDDNSPARRASEMPPPAGPPRLIFKLPHIWQNRISDDIRIVIAFTPVDEQNALLYIRYYQRFLRLPLLNRLVAWLSVWASMIITWQDKRVVLRQRPLKTALRMGEKLIAGDNPIVAYRRRRDRLIQEGDQP